MNSENSETSNPQELLLNLANKTCIKRVGKCVALFYTHYTRKNKKVI